MGFFFQQEGNNQFIFSPWSIWIILPFAPSDFSFFFSMHQWNLALIKNFKFHWTKMTSKWNSKEWFPLKLTFSGIFNQSEIESSTFKREMLFIWKTWILFIEAQERKQFWEITFQEPKFVCVKNSFLGLPLFCMDIIHGTLLLVYNSCAKSGHSFPYIKIMTNI